MKYTVPDGVRRLEFDGVQLAKASSWAKHKPRWVEFELYRTPKNSYVLARTGDSVLFHNEDCALVTRNKLSAVPPEELDESYMPCSDCKATRLDPEGVFPEKPRHQAQVSDDAVGVVASLMRRDPNGTEYLTNVARDLLIEASRWDEQIAEAFYVDRIE